jgi:hypothetical protein
MDNWKFIEGLGSGGFSNPSTLSPVRNGPTGQLYNLDEDSLESNNLFLQNPDIVMKMTEYLDQLEKNGFSRKMMD